ncbi:MAG: YwaF family protein, partial [Clostridia bacterium]|nr:YwaF family protein [Clostridia bacterium]
MYGFLHGLLSDKKEGAIFNCFGIWHICYILLTITLIAVIFIALRKNGREALVKAARVLINTAFGLYMLDFFLMPFAYEAIDIEKLPFHVCTATCVMCFLSRHTRFFSRFRMQFALLGLVSNLIYLFYPAGVMWYQINPLSYRVVQTLTFHGIMTAYGVVTLASEDNALDFRTCWKDLLTVCAMALWALAGNTLYNGTAGSYSHFFNWFFVVRDPFWIIDANIAPFVMPFVVIAAFFAVEMLVYAVYYAIK